MLVFASDLHLADNDSQPFPLDRFLDELRSIAVDARRKGVAQLRLVLLGDIFELLRSSQWIEQGVRPWEENSAQHEQVVDKIMAAIVARHGLFFDGLRQLQQQCPFIDLRYIPGNHDRPLNTDMGQLARRRLDAELAFGRQRETFSEHYGDQQHQVFAFHGHHLDPYNRYRQGRKPVGDVVVTEIMAGMKYRLAQRLSLPLHADALAFIDAVGLVEPQTPRAMAAWLYQGLVKMEASLHSPHAALREVTADIINELVKIQTNVRFERVGTLRWWVRFLGPCAAWIARRISLLDVMKLIPQAPQTRGPYPRLMERELRRRQRFHTPYRFVLCGHTHISEDHPLSGGRMGRGTQRYLNTGTWCRLQHFARGASFHMQHIGTIVLIRSPEEQGAGQDAYEMRTIQSGGV